MASVADRAILRPSATLVDLVPSHTLWQAWRSVGAPANLLHDLVWGVHVPTSTFVPANSADNYKSAAEKSVEVDEALEELRVAGKIEQVFGPELVDTVVSPLGAVPKPDSNKIRVVHDLSLFVNEFVISRDMSLPSIEEFLRWVSPGCWMWKRDWKGGYQQFWVNKFSRRLLGFKWKDGVWRYAVLPFGLNCSAPDFCQFSNFVGSLLQNEGILCWVYMDDEFGLNLSREAALWDFYRAQQWHDFLGVIENLEKAVKPAQVVKILGYVVDSVHMSVSIPHSKVEKISALCVEFLSCFCIRLKDIQTLIGLLVFTARVVRGGWVFLNRLFPLLRVARKGINPWISLTNQSRADVRWWLRLLKNWNGISRVPTVGEIFVFCDSSSFGMGAWWGSRWFSGIWDVKWRPRHINEKELMTIKMAARKWSEDWSGRKVTIFCDNSVAVSVCSKGTSRNPRLAKIMREIFWCLTRASCEVQVAHIQGLLNVRADALSRRGIIEDN